MPFFATAIVSESIEGEAYGAWQSCLNFKSPLLPKARRKLLAD